MAYSSHDAFCIRFYININIMVLFVKFSCFVMFLIMLTLRRVIARVMLYLSGFGS